MCQSLTSACSDSALFDFLAYEISQIVNYELSRVSFEEVQSDIVFGDDIWFDAKSSAFVQAILDSEHILESKLGLCFLSRC